MNNSIDTRDYSELNPAITLAEHIVYKCYLSELEKYPLVESDYPLLDECSCDCLRFSSWKNYPADIDSGTSVRRRIMLYDFCEVF